jgi:4-hydroxybenzoate polyprenyltransferase
MSADEPRADSPWSRRLWAYTEERFPLARHGVLIVSYYSSNQFLAKALTEPGAPMRWDRSSLLGALTLLLFFFHLRVFDEHKDAEDDRRNHPERLLSRGIVTLRELKIAGAVALGGELLLATLAGGAALAGWALAFAFSLVMLAEFFAARWLRARLLVYAALHMLVMPLLSAMIFSFSTGLAPHRAPPLYWLYAFVGFFVTFNWEISRKIRAPEDERAGVDSYTKLFGTFGAAWAVLGVRALDTAMVFVVGWQLALSSWFYVALLALYAVCLVVFLQFRLAPTPAHARRMEGIAGFYIVAFDLALGAALAARFGLAPPFPFGAG